MRWLGRRGGLGLLAGVDGAALVALFPNWRALAHNVAAPHDWVTRAGADDVAAALGGVALWCVAAWLAVGLLAATASALPGTCGRLARRIAAGLLPVVLLRAVAGAIGLSVLAAPVAAGAAGTAGIAGSAGARSAGQPVAAGVRTPGWPTGGGPSGPVAVGWPTSPPPAAPTVPTATPTTTTRAPTAPPPAPPTATIPAPAPPTSPVAGTTSPHGDGTVTVRPGDSLWLIAARRLGDDPSAEQIAAAWPRWYRANRAVIGADPNLIYPGQVLHAPADHPAPERSTS